MRSPRCVPLLLLLLLLLLAPPAGDAAVITGACDKDPQCGGGMCCAVSIWVKSIRICTPMGKLGDSCHPLTRKVSICVCVCVCVCVFPMCLSVDIPGLPARDHERWKMYTMNWILYLPLRSVGFFFPTILLMALEMIPK
ncbi:prokineticin-2 isoform X1 [Perognathus longimembris pacificus]|uniref:prokineticin-2 isoform X1 n=1 Tax=Perognathus longimembris pacificus TaxID=214514 RepID=UPI002019B2D2|nr:prokineticin-2 isoform X1 [Perognathus longimembris pacificus]